MLLEKAEEVVEAPSLVEPLDVDAEVSLAKPTDNFEDDEDDEANSLEKLTRQLEVTILFDVLDKEDEEDWDADSLYVEEDTVLESWLRWLDNDPIDNILELVEINETEENVVDDDIEETAEADLVNEEDELTNLDVAGDEDEDKDEDELGIVDESELELRVEALMLVDPVDNPKEDDWPDDIEAGEETKDDEAVDDKELDLTKSLEWIELDTDVFALDEEATKLDDDFVELDELVILTVEELEVGNPGNVVAPWQDWKSLKASQSNASCAWYNGQLVKVTRSQTVSLNPSTKAEPKLSVYNK